MELPSMLRLANGLRDHRVRRVEDIVRSYGALRQHASGDRCGRHAAEVDMQFGLMWIGIAHGQMHDAVGF